MTRGMVRGPMRMTHDGTFGGMLNGDLTIAAGVTAVIAGMVNGDVIVEPGATARIAGMVNGRIVDRGGTIETGGLVRG